MFSCRYSVSSAEFRATRSIVGLTCVNSSASQRAMSSDASGLEWSACPRHLDRQVILTLDSSGLKSIKRVSSIILVVSTSSASLLRQLIRLLRPPDATEAGYTLAKLRSPRIAALRSSRSVALCSRPLKVTMVDVAFCLAGACFSRMLNIFVTWRHYNRMILVCVGGTRVASLLTCARLENLQCFLSLSTLRPNRA